MSTLEKTEFTKKLGVKLRELRTEKGISQTELARRCGKDQQHIELIENGKTTCTSYTLYLILLNLDCKQADIFQL